MSIAAASSPSRGGIGGMSVMLSLSGFWLLSVLNDSPYIFSDNDLLFLACAAAAVLSAQAAVCFFLRKRRALASGTTALFSVVNIACCYLVFWTPFAVLSAAAQITILAAAATAAFFFYSFLDDSKAMRRAAMIVAGGLFFHQAAMLATGDSLAAGDKPPPGMTSHADIRLVEFKRRPNVYVLSFDGLIPRPLADKHLQIGELPYQDYMEENDFHVFRNFFSDAVYTEKSLANFLGLGTERFRTDSLESFDAYRAYDGAFTGQFPSPLVEIFQANGYTANSYMGDHYFGDHKGPHMDYYHVRVPFSLCSYLADTAARFGFWGYCHMLSSLLVNNVFGLAEFFGKNYGEWLRDQFARSLKSQQHSFSIVYIYTPRHTPADYAGRPEQFADYRQFFNRQKHQAADYIRILAGFIRDNDPGALLFIFGDHGVKLTNMQSWEGQKDKTARAFFIHDRYGVLGGVHPKDACSEWQDLGVYVTPAKVGRAIVRCLSGEDPFLRPPSYALDDDYWGYTGDTPLRYEDYLYE